MADVAIINLCQGFRIERSLSVGNPLVSETLRGGASLGCFPVIAHRKISGTDVIVSRINRRNAVYDRLLVEIGPGPDDVDTSFPIHTALVAAVPATPLTGTIIAPYPVPTPPLDFGLLHRVGGNAMAWASWDTGETPPTPLTNGIVRHLNANDNFYLISFDGVEFLDTLPGGSVALRPLRTFRIFTVANYNPEGLPQALVFLSSGQAFSGSPSGYYWPGIEDQDTIPLFDGTSGSAQFQAHFWAVSPGVDTLLSGASTITGGASVFPFNGSNAVMADRGALYFPNEDVTMPTFGGVINRDYDVTPARPTFIMYANADVDAIAINGVAGDAYPVDGLPTLPASRSSSTVGSFLTTPPLTDYTKAFSWTGFEEETEFEIEVQAFSETMTDGPFTVGLPNARNVIEGIVVARTV